MDWFLLALLSAFSLASADAFTKRFLRGYTAGEIVVVRSTGTALLLSPLLLDHPLSAMPGMFWVWLAAALPLEGLAMLLYMRAIQQSPLALTVPYLAFTPVFTVLTGWIFLGETVSKQGFAGILLVAAGAYILNLQSARRRGTTAWLAPLRSLYREPGSRLMIIVAFLYSLTGVFGKAELHYVSPVFFGPFYFGLFGLFTAGAALVRRPRTFRALGRNPGRTVILSALMAVMIMSHFAAIARVDAAYMIAVKRTSLLFGILYGALLFKESGLRKHLFAGTVMLAGIALLVL